jgi:alpha-L-rhamnosidase
MTVSAVSMHRTAAESLADADLITADVADGVAPIVSRRFRLDRDRGAVRSATLVATAHGVYEPCLNGEAVTAGVLNPGWTAYEWRLQIQTFDVTSLLATENELSLLIGNGWFRGDLGFLGAAARYGDEIGVAAALSVVYADGHEQRIVTGPDWSGRPSAITANSLYDGQTVDFRRTADAHAAAGVRVLPFARETLVPQTGPLITRHEVLRPQRIWESPSGSTLVDFGQNLVGWIRCTVRGERGTTVTIRHAEVLEHGELGVRPLRDAKATDTLVLSGGDDVFEPTLTFHGFRYAEVSGWPGTLGVDDLEAVVVHSDLDRTGRFECSDPRVNQLIRNVDWGQKGNFLDVPTDCPQRDERLGWTGDIAVFAPAAAFAFDVSDFLHKWLLDLGEETRARNGAVPVVVPDVLKYAGFMRKEHPPRMFTAGATAVWGDAAVWVPEALWHAYGDLDRLAAHYPGMVAHTDLVEASLSAVGVWDTGFQFGDWLDPDAPPEDPAAGKADPAVVATACAFRTARFTAEAARLLGRSDDAVRFEAMAVRLRRAFGDRFVTEDLRIASDCTTVYALAIRFGLLDGDARVAAGRRLVELVRESGHTVSTGFAGTPYVTWALTDTGHVDDAYRLLLQTESPSWLYAVAQGATTIWERWDSMLPDGSIHPGSMTSFNHYALGAVADWVYQVVGGIRPAAPGYARVRIEPVPGPGISWARSELATPCGLVTSAWSTTSTGFELTVSLPDGVSGLIVLPSGTTHRADGGCHTYRE